MMCEGGCSHHMQVHVRTRLRMLVRGGDVWQLLVHVRTVWVRGSEMRAAGAFGVQPVGTWSAQV